MNVIVIIISSIVGYLLFIVFVIISVFVGLRFIEFIWKYNYRLNMDKLE